MDTATGTIKVMIADDESIVRKGLQATVPWEKYGMEVVADAANGRKAWEAFQLHRPQIVITDIVMPEMDGIELSRRVKQAAPDTRIVLLSCHRDFEYAKEGLKLGVSGYLLKTAFEDEELEGMLEQFRKELCASRTDAGGDSDEGVAEERLGTQLYAWLSGHSDKFARELEKLAEARSWRERALYVYVIKSGLNWRDAADILSRDDTLKNEGALIPFSEERWYWMLPAVLADTASGWLVERKSEHAELLWSRSGPVEGPQQWLRAISELHKEAEMEKAYGVSSGEWPEPIWKALRLMHDNPAADWSVSDVAGQVGLSRSHFSILFKKSVGLSFVAYQYKRKLKIARELLKDTSLTMQDIAERTGLGDSKYFSKWFKRCTGQTPSHYRTQQKDGASRTE